MSDNSIPASGMIKPLVDCSLLGSSLKKIILISNLILSCFFWNTVGFLIDCLSFDAVHAIAPAAPMTIGGCDMRGLEMSEPVKRRGPLTVSPVSLGRAKGCEWHTISSYSHNGQLDIDLYRFTVFFLYCATLVLRCTGPGSSSEEIWMVSCGIL